MASARNLVTTRCNWPCRPMRWYGPVHGFPPTSHLILRSPSAVLGSVLGLGDPSIYLSCFLSSEPGMDLSASPSPTGGQTHSAAGHRPGPI